MSRVTESKYLHQKEFPLRIITILLSLFITGSVFAFNTSDFSRVGPIEAGCAPAFPSGLKIMFSITLILIPTKIISIFALMGDLNFLEILRALSIPITRLSVIVLNCLFKRKQ